MTFPRQPLKHLAAVSVSNVDKKSVEGDHPVRLVNYTDVYYGDRITPALPLMDATATAQQLEAFRLRPGDVAITKDSETADDIGIAAFIEESAPDLVLGYHLALLRPRHSAIDPRFLYWCMRSDLARGQLSTGATGVTRFGLRQDVIASMSLPKPPLQTQRAIADFLDVETARIDALIAKKGRMIDLLDERRADAVETAVRGLGAEHAVQPLKRSVDAVTVGIVVTPSEWYGDHGVLALRGLNVRPGSIDTADVVYLTEEGHRLHKKSELHAGDVVVVRTGQAGAASVVPPELHGSNCIDLLIVRPGSMDPTFLSFVLNSDWTQKHIANHSVGSIQSHFNVGALRELPVPAAPIQAQVSVSARLQADAVQHLALRIRLERQLALLHEHRQALITAAVTGELEVPGVAA